MNGNPKVPAEDRGARPGGASLALTVGALGVVFGDIGTSVLYALRECFSGPHGVAVTRFNVLGSVSLLLWTLILVVCAKYVLVVMRADNRGEGGILALMTLVVSLRAGKTKYGGIILFLGILGAALLYGDGVITPAISVLSAVEGLNVASTFFQPYVMPLSLGILIALFFVQFKGTGKVGMLFGPVIFVWFLTIGIVGLFSIINHPAVLAAASPVYAFQFLFMGGVHSFALLGSVFLAVTGAEVLYADMGHFGRTPITRAWFWIAFPCLILNYTGQGAYLLGAPTSVENLFFRIAPPWFLFPLVAIATVATVIASQAVISGAFSLAKQSVQLGFWPRMQVLHTSASQIGQVYVPVVNWALMAGVAYLIVTFKESGNLAAAYGIAVSATMLITTVLITYVARRKWRVHLAALIPLAVFFFVFDGSFFLSNMAKVMSGGWIVLTIAAGIAILMLTWLRGRELLRTEALAMSMDIGVFVQDVARNNPRRVPGTAVFLSGNPNGVPRALLHNLKDNKILHEQTVLLSVKTEEVPYVSPSDRARAETLGHGLFRIMLSYGFSETPDIPAALKNIDLPGVGFDPMKTSFFLGRESLVVSRRRTMAVWRKQLFAFMSHNALNPTAFYRIPYNRVVELGSQIEL